MKNTRIVLASRPRGWPEVGNFRVEEVDVRSPTDGEVVVKNHFLSLDPYMRSRMNEGKSYAAPQPLDEVMIGGTAGEVVESKDPRFAVGDRVVGMLGWQEVGVVDGRGLTKVDPRVPLSAYLGAVGMPGVTAHYGLLEIGQPKAGETVVVSAAAGAVGGVVGQIAKLRGARAVGIAGGEAKCAYVTGELGFDACVDYKSPDFGALLKKATPDGIDVYFENVGGAVLDAVLPRLNTFARVPLCGLVSQYNATEPYGVKNFTMLLLSRVKVQGFIVSDHMDRWPAALADLAGWWLEGKLRGRETIAEGLRSAPAAFLGMLRGDNVGKQLVRL